MLTQWAGTSRVRLARPDAGDRTLGVIVRAVTGALRARVPGLPADLVAAVSGPQGPDTGTDEAGGPRPTPGGSARRWPSGRQDLVLVLDDTEAIEGAPESVAFVAGLCRQAPATLHIVLSSAGTRRSPWPGCGARGRSSTWRPPTSPSRPTRPRPWSGPPAPTPAWPPSCTS